MEQNETTTTLTPDAMIAQLRAMRQQIPDYMQLTNKQVRSLITASGVSPDMVNAAANAISESAMVQSAVGATVEEIRQSTSDAAVWGALETELAATLHGVAVANLQRRYRLGTVALTTYAVSRALVRTAEHTSLLPHVAEMRRTNRIGRGRKATPSPNPQPHAGVTPTTQ
jgi:hypothetical protein